MVVKLISELPISLKIGILLGVSLNLYIALGKINILAKFILSNNKQIIESHFKRRVRLKTI